MKKALQAVGDNMDTVVHLGTQNVPFKGKKYQECLVLFDQGSQINLAREKWCQMNHFFKIPYGGLTKRVKGWAYNIILIDKQGKQQNIWALCVSSINAISKITVPKQKQVPNFVNTTIQNQPHGDMDLLVSAQNVQLIPKNICYETNEYIVYKSVFSNKQQIQHICIGTIKGAQKDNITSYQCNTAIVHNVLTNMAVNNLLALDMISKSPKAIQRNVSTINCLETLDSKTQNALKNSHTYDHSKSGVTVAHRL